MAVQKSSAEATNTNEERPECNGGKITRKTSYTGHGKLIEGLNKTMGECLRLKRADGMAYSNTLSFEWNEVYKPLMEAHKTFGSHLWLRTAATFLRKAMLIFMELCSSQLQNWMNLVSTPRRGCYLYKESTWCRAHFEKASSESQLNMKDNSGEYLVLIVLYHLLHRKAFSAS